MKVVHFSDWHAAFRELPEADLYVCTGDMMKDFHCYGPARDEFLMEQSQREWADSIPSLRVSFGSPKAPVVCVRGNHDFTPLSILFRGGPVFEINEPNDVYEFGGLRFGGCRGINYIVGFWSDELREPDFNHVTGKLPLDLDVLVTHSPPWGILDQWEHYSPGGGHLGAEAISRYLTRAQYEGKMPKAHLFGHIHESCGLNLDTNGILFSNAATTVNVLEL
jgi:Icc-related predicted phosphoesterase